ncbi:YhcH/YjgK/YiaL family protein [Telmatospirillum sp.]|uniref:YhcH/YjgK/YiaL family protein n=1 Tax=Telmatospirillum sp. TaxID=2079197 RepID=UPI0028476376|nr:YhcH/YjgK/YiaL family protein [Telmatospirillum sp.]MDR3435065.1 YhcH/YjgK/YiaL family protein [Telmatospirillum sp.]
MIFGNVNNLKDMLPWLPIPLRTAMSYLMGTDFELLPAGRYDLEGDNIYVLIQDATTKPKEDRKPEVHRKYIDVQFLVRGQEAMGIATDTGNNKIRDDLLAERDVIFYEDMENESRLVFKPGDFAIFFPSDVHRPVCQVDESESIRKVVVKVRTDYFNNINLQ